MLAPRRRAAAIVGGAALAAAALVVVVGRRRRRKRHGGDVTGEILFGAGTHGASSEDRAPVAVPVADGRGRGFALDVDGFELFAGAVPRGPFRDAKSLVADLFPRVEAFVASKTGGGRVLAFDHLVRSASHGAGGEAAAASPYRLANSAPGDLRRPLATAHGDYTARSGPSRARQLLAPHASAADVEGALARGFALVNVWLPFSTVEADPLALMTWESCGPRDVRVNRLTFAHRVGETYTVVHAPTQRWVYFPRVRPDEAVVLKTYDSRQNVARFCLHSAFSLPPTDPPAPPRASVEIRCLVLFGADAAFAPTFTPPHMVVADDPNANESKSIQKTEVLPASDAW